MGSGMDPETLERLVALFKKTGADVIADWNWPIWRPDEEDRPPRDE